VTEPSQASTPPCSVILGIRRIPGTAAVVQPPQLPAVRPSIPTPHPPPFSPLPQSFLVSARAQGCAFCGHLGHRIHTVPAAEGRISEYVNTGRVRIINCASTFQLASQSRTVETALDLRQVLMLPGSQLARSTLPQLQPQPSNATLHRTRQAAASRSSRTQREYITEDSDAKTTLQGLRRAEDGSCTVPTTKAPAAAAFASAPFVPLSIDTRPALRVRICS
jgi:hypothetical protein